MFVSIIIPTYNDWETLSFCLDALARQSYASNMFEIIIVNNNPALQHPETYPIPLNCRIVDEAKPGSYAARNKGIEISKGHILGFTDSDCIPDENWIYNAVTYMIDNSDAERIAGHVELFYKAAKLNHVELYETVFAFNQELYVKQDASSVTANMFTYRRIFKEVGLFNEAMMSGGDYEWSKRAQNCGVSIHYLKTAFVKHPSRFRIDELLIKAKRVGGGQAMFKSNKGKKFISAFFRLLYDLRPPVKTIPVINARGRKFNIYQKSMIFYIRYYLSIVTAIEKFEVKTGKVPHRV